MVSNNKEEVVLCVEVIRLCYNNNTLMLTNYYNRAKSANLMAPPKLIELRPVAYRPVVVLLNGILPQKH